MGCYNSCIVEGPVDRVWALLRNFHDLTWATGVVVMATSVLTNSRLVGISHTT